MNEALIFLAQRDQLTEIQRAVRDQFREGGSFLGVAGALAFILFIVLVAWWLTSRAERGTNSSDRPDPSALFDEVIEKLGLETSKAALLNQMAHRAELNHPVVMLLSRELFDRTAATYGRSLSAAANSTNEQLIEQLRRELFV